MQSGNSLLERLPRDSVTLKPIEPLGRAIRLFLYMFSPATLLEFDWRIFFQKCLWLGWQSFPLIALSSIFVAGALTIQTVNEMRAFRAQDLSGAVISLGLLREIGPLTVSLAWSARVAALLADESKWMGHMPDAQFARQFIFPRYVAGLLMSVPLSGYGLVIGFATACIWAPILGVSSSNDFLQSARVAIDDKDLVVYFVKLILLNPTVACFAGCAIGRLSRANDKAVAANAVTAMFIAACITNLIYTFIMYPH